MKSYLPSIMGKTTSAIQNCTHNSIVSFHKMKGLQKGSDRILVSVLNNYSFDPSPIIPCDVIRAMNTILILLYYRSSLI